MVHQILDLLAAGKLTDVILSEDYFPELSIAHLTACLAPIAADTK